MCQIVAFKINGASDEGKSSFSFAWENLSPAGLCLGKDSHSGSLLLGGLA